MDRVATPSRRTRSSAKRVDPRKKSDSGQSDESDHQVNVTRRSIKRKDLNVHKSNGDNLSSGEDPINARTHNGSIIEHTCMKINRTLRSRRTSQDSNDSENSNLSTISENPRFNLEPNNISGKTVSKGLSVVDERPECNIEIDSKLNVVDAEKKRVESCNADKDITIERQIEVFEETCNEDVGDNQLDVSKQNSIPQIQEVPDVKVETITNINENVCIQEHESNLMDTYQEKNKVDVSQQRQLDKTINSEVSSDESDATKHARAKGVLLDTSQIINCNEQNISGLQAVRIENTMPIHISAPDTSKVTKQSTFENINNNESTNGRSGSAWFKDGLIENCSEYSNDIFLDERQNKVKDIEHSTSNSEESSVCDENKLNIGKHGNSNIVESEETLDLNEKITDEGNSNTVLTDKNMIYNQEQLTEADAEAMNLVNVPIKTDENIAIENMDVERETNIEATGSLNTNHKKFRRKNEAPDNNLSNSEHIISNQVAPIELSELHTNLNDESVDEQIVIDDSSSSSSSPSLKENSDNSLSEDVDYNSDNLMNEIACNFGAKVTRDIEEQCKNTDLGNAEEINKNIESVPNNESTVKGNENVTNVVDNIRVMRVENIPPTTNINNAGSETADEVDNNYMNPELEANLNINIEGNDNNLEMGVSKTGDGKGCNKTQTDSIVDKDDNLKFNDCSLSVNESNSEHVSKLEPTERDIESNERDSSPMIVGDEPSISNLIVVSEISAGNSCSLSLDGALKPMAIPNETVTLNEDDELFDNVKKEAHSESNSDIIYKDMADLSSKKGELKDGSLYEHESSSDQYFDKGESEENGSSDNEEEEVDDEEEVDEEEEELDEEDIEEEKTKEENNEIGQEEGIGEKGKNKAPSITYDQALAILNKNRVKKIDDEEFYDLFTQELNKVSSDSDVAIVDEYLMEPEEIEDSLGKKGGKPQQITQSPRPILQKQNALPAENLQYIQQGPPEHGHQNVDISNLGFSQGLYNPYNPSMPQLNAPIMAYDHYGPGPSNAPPLMTGYNPQMSTGMHYSRPPMYNHHISSNGPKPYSQGSFMGPTALQNQRSMVQGTRPGNTQQTGSSRYDPERNVPNAINMEQGDEHGQERRPNKSDDPNTPVLNVLGLNKEKLVLLRKVLGLDSKIDKRCLRDSIISNFSSPSSTKVNKHVQKRKSVKKHQKGPKKTKQRDYKVAFELLFKSILNSNKILQNVSVENTSEENTCSRSSCTDDTSSSDDTLARLLEMREENSDHRQLPAMECRKRFDKDKYHKENIFKRDSNWKSIENLSLGKKHSKNVKNSKGNKYSKNKAKIVQSNENCYSSDTEYNTKNINRKRKFKEASSDGSIGDVSGSEESKKTVHKIVKAQSRKNKFRETKSSILKSKCGTFQIDSTGKISESSGSDSQSQDETAVYLVEMKKKMMKEIAEGKCKSNMFKMVSNKEPKRKRREEDEDQFKRDKKKIKIPTTLLERLAEAESSGSDTSENEHRTKRSENKKKARKMKVNSIALKKSYIPCATTGVSTQFNLQRLDSDDPQSSAQIAENFRHERLYGSTNRRIPSKELLSMMEKKKRSDFATH